MAQIRPRQFQGVIYRMAFAMVNCMSRIVNVRCWIAGMVSLAACAVEGQSAADPAAGEPAAAGLVCEKPVYEFGSIANDQPVKHTFVLNNPGTNAVRILNVRAGCGCATTEIATNPVPAGQSTTVRVVKHRFTPVILPVALPLP